MPRTHGYSRKGERCYGSHDWGAKGRTNVIGALIGNDLLTANLLQTPLNTTIFSNWIKDSLIPKLPNNSVVIRDNATFHKGDSVKNTTEEAGHTLFYLPPYSPDLNPIEHKWAQIKAQKRKTQMSLEQIFEKQ